MKLFQDFVFGVIGADKIQRQGIVGLEGNVVVTHGLIKGLECSCLYQRY